MSRKFRIASFTSLALTMMTMLVAADSSGVAAQDRTPEVLLPQAIYSPQPVAEPIASEAIEAAPAVVEPQQVEELEAAKPVRAASLAALVAAQPQAPLSAELECLAGAIFFEAKSEALAGQLAVGKVIIARAKSGRFPASYCGVVYQPSQFSFVRGRTMPKIDRSSRDWREAAAVARIAHADSWESPVEGALFFHAAHVSPGWRLKRIAKVENHVFYR
jgi:N-acetylmuramoyl-L-alanine amidase